MSKAHMPPVPPAGRSDKGPGGEARENPAADEKAKASGAGAKDGNTAQQGRAGNVAQNTTHDGHQQDR